MSTLSTKADALRVLAAKLDRIDREIKELLGDSPTITMQQVDLPPIKRLEILRPFLAVPTPPAPWRNVVIEPKVPPLAFGQVIFFQGIGPRFITKHSEGVSLIGVEGVSHAKYHALTALAEDVDMTYRGARMYSWRPSRISGPAVLDFGDVIYMRSWVEKRNEPRFIARGKYGVHLIGPEGEIANTFPNIETLIDNHVGADKQYTRFPQ